MSSKLSECLETIDDLTSVFGGFDAGKCFDDVWPWAAGGAGAGALMSGGLGAPAGALIGGVAAGGPAFMTSPNCGSDGKSPATILREGAANSLSGPTNNDWMQDRPPQL
jgi:hypothetical protein